MSKRPPKQGNISFAPPPGARPTVSLPGSAFGGSRPTVPLPPSVGGVAARPSPQELAEALKRGGAFLASGRLKEAEAVAQLALRFFPGHPDALHLLGLVAYEAGKPEEAERLIGLAAANGKPHATLMVNLGNAKRSLGKFDEAEAAYNQAVKLDRNSAGAYLNRAILFKHLNKPDFALRDFESMTKLSPQNPLPYVQAVQVALHWGRFREALVFCKAARDRLPNPPAVIFVLTAEIYERLSEFDEALVWINQALSIDPTHVDAKRVRSLIRRRQSKGDKAVLIELRAELEAIDTSGLAPDHARALHAELAQICEKLNDTDAAYYHFKRQNEEAAKEVDSAHADKNEYLKRVEDLIEGFTQEWLRGAKSLPPPLDNRAHRSPPVFLVGFPRSGTTLLDQILDSHPDVQVLEEVPVLLPVRHEVEAAPAGYLGRLAEIDERDREKLRRIYWQALEDEGLDLKNKIVINKMPLNIIQSGLIGRVFPDAKIILALRHPADSVLSCFMQDFQLNASMANFLTLEDAAHLYDRVMTLWQQYRALLPLNVVEVRYENLIRDIRSEVEPVLDFLGLAWNEAQADPAAHALARGTIRTPSYSQVTQPIYSSSADRWRRYDKYLAPVLPVLEKHIRYFGYPL